MISYSCRTDWQFYIFFFSTLKTFLFIMKVRSVTIWFLIASDKYSYKHWYSSLNFLIELLSHSFTLGRCSCRVFSSSLYHVSCFHWNSFSAYYLLNCSLSTPHFGFPYTSPSFYFHLYHPAAKIVLFSLQHMSMPS